MIKTGTIKVGSDVDILVQVLYFGDRSMFQITAGKLELKPVLMSFSLDLFISCGFYLLCLVRQLDL